MITSQKLTRSLFAIVLFAGLASNSAISAAPMQRSTGTVATVKNLISRAIPYGLTFAYYKYVSESEKFQLEDKAYNTAKGKIFDAFIGIWLLDRIKNDARDIESAVLEELAEMGIIDSAQEA